MFTGAMVALVTPFHEGKIDIETLDELDRIPDREAASTA